MDLELDRELCIISVALLLLTYLWGTLSFYKARKLSPENPVLFALILIFSLLFVGRFILSIYDYYLTFLDSTRFAEFIWWWKIGMLVHNMSFVVLCFVVERQLFQGRDLYVFFIGFISSLVLMVVMPNIEAAEWFTLTAYIFSVFIPIGMLKIGINSKGEMRRRILYAFFGFILFIISGLIVGQIPITFLTDITGWSRYIIHIISNTGQILAAYLFARGYL